jgi:hypothetical protein
MTSGAAMARHAKVILSPAGDHRSRQKPIQHRSVFDRAGYAQTVCRCRTAPRCRRRASFNAVFDAANWDRSIAQNPPGQSELPDPHFGTPPG